MSVLHAQLIEVNYSDTKFENFNVQYLQTDSALTVDQVKNSSFKPINSQNAFYGHSGSIWYKIEIKNISQIDKKLFLHEDFAYFSKIISVYEFKNQKLFDQNRYDVLDSGENNKLIGSALVHPFVVEANGNITIFIKNEYMVSSLVDFKIYNQKESLKALTNKTFYSNIIITVLITLALYNFMLFLFNKRKEFLYYSLYLLNAGVGLSYMYGSLFNNFYLYGEKTYWFNITAILVSLFLSLFIKYTFNTRKVYKRVDLLFNIIIYLVLANIALAIFVNLTVGIAMANVVFVLSFFVLIYFSYVLIKTSHPLAKIFTIAYGVYIVGFFIVLLSLSGAIPLNDFTFHSSGIALVLEALMFSYLIQNHIKILENKLREQRELIISKNKKEQLGDMISAITHQWKQPLARITSITTLLDFRLEQGTKINNKDLKEKISQIESNIHFLSHTIDDFKDFFNPNSVAEICDISRIIDQAIELSSDDTLAKEVTIKTDLNFERKISIHRNELLHIILNVIQNAKEAFYESNEEIKMIKIFGNLKNDKVEIDIIDNAGGISEENLPLIFNENYTTKKKKAGSGLGLYLTRVILEEHLKGSIEAKNIEGGTMFRIIV